MARVCNWPVFKNCFFLKDFNEKQATSVGIHLVVWPYVGKVEVGVHSQANTQPASLPGNSCHLLPRDF